MELVIIQMSNPGAKKNIVLLGFVSLLNDISSEIIQPILPLFITSLGGGAVAVGLIGGIADGLPSILQVFVGYCSDLWGRRKPLVVAGYGLSAVSKLFLPFSWTWQQVFAIKALERCGKGVRSAPRDALISESVDENNQGKGFGIHRAMDSSGAVIGSILAYALWIAGLDFRTIFLIAAAMAVASLIPFHMVEERPKVPNGQLKLSVSDLSPGLRKFLVVACLFALGNFSYMFFILRAQQLFSGKEAIAAPLLLYVLFNLVYAGMAAPVGIWSDKIGRRNVLALGYAIFAATALGFATVSSLAGVMVLFALYGLVYAIVDSMQSAFVSDLSSSCVRSTSLGLYYGATGVTAILSSLLAGALWTQFGASATFVFGAAASALAALALLRMKAL
ncbi:MAG: MFS transporter [Methanothrix sp.]|jgi:MFS family permease|nr:MFS transporter [Methanothrix sp.]OPY46831.1 MAG: multidrug resistance protein MdtH [Methanosaeta sp. PtaU1.Bin016]